MPSSTPLQDIAFVSFHISVPYSHALRVVTNLGLQPTIPHIGATTYKNGRVHTWVPWSPVGEKDVYALVQPIITSSNSIEPEPQQTRCIWITNTPLTAAHWVKRLKETPGVQSVEIPEWWSSPAIHTGPIPSGVVIALAEEQAGTYAQLAFSLSENGYDAALFLISDLGLRLADPCYEEAQNEGTPLNWHPMGQEDIFARERVLVVATTKVSPVDWDARLRSVPEITSIVISFTARC